MKRVFKRALACVLAICFALPVFTLYTSITALHFVNFKLEEDENINVIKEFFKSFKLNFLQSLFFLLIPGLIVALVGFAWYKVIFKVGEINLFIVVILFIVSLFVLGFNTICTYLLAKFKNTALKLFVFSLYIGSKHSDKTLKIAAAESVMIGVPLLIVAVNPGVVSLIVGIVVFYVLMIVFEGISSKLIIPMYDELIEQGKKAE